MMRSNGAATDTTRNGLGVSVSGGKPSSRPPTDYGSEYAEWLDRAERIALALEREVDGGTIRVREKTSETLRAVIRDYEGRKPEFVAFVENCSVALVRKVRTTLGLDAVTGERRPAPITDRTVPSEFLSTPERNICSVGEIGEATGEVAHA
jgi:hypothetical protein